MGSAILWWTWWPSHVYAVSAQPSHRVVQQYLKATLTNPSIKGEGQAHIILPSYIMINTSVAGGNRYKITGPPRPFILSIYSPFDNPLNNTMFYVLSKFICRILAGIYIYIHFI
jgi:hypothetical protein